MLVCWRNLVIKKIAHIGIATHSIDAMLEFYKKLGLEVKCTEIVKDQQVKVAVMQVGDSAIELIESTAESSPVSRFISSRGQGLHHVTFEVDDLEKHLEILKDQNSQTNYESYLVLHQNLKTIHYHMFSHNEQLYQIYRN